MANNNGCILLKSGEAAVFLGSLKDSTGGLVKTGTTTLMLLAPQADGSCLTYDFNDNTFKSTACTTTTASMTVQQANNNTVDTGIWTYALSTLTGLTVGQKLIAVLSNSGAVPPQQEYLTEYGGVDGDGTVVVDGATDDGKTAIANGVATAPTDTAAEGSSLYIVQGVLSNSQATYDAVFTDGVLLTSAYDNAKNLPAWWPVNLDLLSVSETGEVEISDTSKQGIWDTLSSGLSTTGSIGKLIVDTFTTQASNWTTLLGKYTGITSLANWLRAMFRKTSADATALSEINTGGGTYDPATDSDQALADAIGGIEGGTASTTATLNHGKFKV